MSFWACVIIFSLPFFGLITWIRKLYNEIKIKDEMIQSLTIEQSLDTIIKKLDVHGEKIDTINRGLYGDPNNNVPGLIQRQAIDEQRLDKLEEINKTKALAYKRYGWFAGAAIAVTEGLHQCSEWLVKFFTGK